MKKYFDIKKIALLIALIFIFTFSAQGTLAYVVATSPTLMNTFIPGVRYLNSLIISKLVEHPFGQGYEIPEDIFFAFLVDLGQDYAGETISTTVGDYLADENGCITVMVKPGSSVGIVDIAEGTEVTVTELLVDGNGFTVKDGQPTKVVTINEKTTVDYINIYAPAKVESAMVQVTGTKILEGRDWADGDTFSFTLEYETADDQWKVLGTQSVTYDSANPEFNQFNFAKLIETIEFSKVGEYHFRVSEVIGSDDTIDYDETVNYFTIQVTDKDMDGKLEIGNVTAAQNVTVAQDAATGVYTVNVTFNNTYVPPVVPDPEDITLSILVDKTVTATGKDTIGEDGFLFLLENLTNEDLNTVLTTDANGDAVYELTFTAGDLGKTFQYRLTEVNDGKEGVTYSEVEYLVDITITLDEQNNKLKANISVNGESAERIVAAFENKYTKPDVSAPTGDTAQPVVLIVMMVLSAAGIVALLIGGRKRRKDEEDT